MLGEESYQFAYENPGSVKSFLETVCRTNTLLVVGASLADEDVLGALKAVKAVAGADSHYAILGLPEDASTTDHASDFLDRFGLQAVFYPIVTDGQGREDHTALENLLQDLVARAVPEGAVPVEAPALDTSSAFDLPPAPRVVHSLFRAAEYQSRPVYERPLDEFIASDRGGVLALIGVGGSGKTALAREALARTMEGSNLHGTFIWSFYDQPDAAGFLLGLAGYVAREKLPEDTRAARAFDLLRGRLDPQMRLLIVMDGLEKLQLERPDDRNVHGALEDKVLQQLLLWVAQTPLAARVPVTTRFALPDLEPEADRGRVELLEVDFLTRAQARALLRERSVKQGTDRDLDALLDHYGAHALMVDHLGGVIAAYLGGDPRRFQELVQGPITRFEAGASGKRLARVIAAYQGYLERDEPAVRATLERVVIFHGPVGIELLERVFLAPERSGPAGALAGLEPLELQGCLNRLAELRLLRPEQVTGAAVYTVHPAVRDAVLEGLGGERINLADAARSTLASDLDSVVGRPGAEITDPAALDFVEDLIGLCIDAGEPEQAFSLYRDRLGGYLGLGATLGEYSRGERITRRLVMATESADGIPERRHWLVVTDFALFLREVGRPGEALSWFRVVAGPDHWPHQPTELSVARQNLAEILEELGQVPASEEMAALALEAAEEADDDAERTDTAFLVSRPRRRSGGTFSRRSATLAKRAAFRTRPTTTTTRFTPRAASTFNACS